MLQFQALALLFRLGLDKLLKDASYWLTKECPGEKNVLVITLSWRMPFLCSSANFSLKEATFSCEKVFLDIFNF